MLLSDAYDLTMTEEMSALAMCFIALLSASLISILTVPDSTHT